MAADSKKLNQNAGSTLARPVDSVHFFAAQQLSDKVAGI
jgi:hypothetical protein